VRGATLVAALAALGLGGCGYNCQSTCFRIYDPSACAVVIPGSTPEALKRSCISECDEALSGVGTMGGYDPRTQGNPQIATVLENERQAAEWMDCVWEAECTQLQPPGGICHPI